MRGRTGLDIAKPLSGACGCRTGGRDWIKENPLIRHPRVVGKLLTCVLALVTISGRYPLAGGATTKEETER